MRAGLPALTDRMVEAVIAEVPAFALAAQESWRPVIYASADQLLTALIEQLRGAVDPEASATPMQEVLDTAYGFGRREARQGRPTEVQLAAYRIGVREIWREWSALAVRHGVGSDEVSVFAETSFAYLDRISAAGVAGHADELARLGLARERHRERLVRALLRQGSADELRRAAEEAAWTPSQTLTAVALPYRHHESGGFITADPRTLEVPDDAIELPRGMRMFLVSGVGGTARAPFLDSVAGTGAVVGPVRPWMQAHSSIRRVKRAAEIQPAQPAALLDTDQILVALVVSADAEALNDLRARTLTPLEGFPAATRARLADTLRSWLLHHGRRDEIAADLHVSPSTVRYRLRQLRDVYGERLQDPRSIAEFTVALADRGFTDAEGDRDLASASGDRI
ncbi:helix-turn-helix domain-containing protein [Mycobacterium sp. NPDC050551]|uniref:PucR family transcriptional regulator n=1 Tax=Mycobacterium sp. NPDC050551 TaxID=3155407 RepID=UPI0034310921